MKADLVYGKHGRMENKVKSMKTDVLIVGSGCSALYMALHLPEDLNMFRTLSCP